MPDRILEWKRRPPLTRTLRRYKNAPHAVGVSNIPNYERNVPSYSHRHPYAEPDPNSYPTAGWLAGYRKRIRD